MIAESIVKHLDTPLVTRTEIAGAGFINFYLAADTVYSELKQILKAGPSYGDLPKIKKTASLSSMSRQIRPAFSTSDTPEALPMARRW